MSRDQLKGEKEMTCSQVWVGVTEWKQGWGWDGSLPRSHIMDEWKGAWTGKEEAVLGAALEDAPRQRWKKKSSKDKWKGTIFLSFFFSFFLARPKACENSQTKDGTQTTAETWATVSDTRSLTHTRKLQHNYKVNTMTTIMVKTSMTTKSQMGQQRNLQQ